MILLLIKFVGNEDLISGVSGVYDTLDVSAISFVTRKELPYKRIWSLTMDELTYQAIRLSEWEAAYLMQLVPLTIFTIYKTIRGKLVNLS